MKKLSKVVPVILAIMMLLSLATTVVMASGAITPSEIGPDKSTLSVSSIEGLGNDIVRILSTIGIVVSVAVLIVLGIKYMVGSAEEKAEYKKTLLPYVIGAALVFAASAIAQIVYNFTSGISA